MDQSTAITAAVLLMSAPGVLALVKAIDHFVGLPGYWKFVVSLVLGIGLNVGAFLSGIAYVGAPIFAVVCVGVVAALAASGFWDVASNSGSVTVVQTKKS